MWSLLGGELAPDEVPIDEQLLFSYITQIAGFPTAAGVVFTGGEPTLRKDLLLRAIAFSLTNAA